MTWLSRRMASTDRSPWGDFWFQPVGASGGVVRVTPDSALQITAVFACARVLAESFAILPFRLYRPKIGGGRQQVRDHWLYRLFAKAPNRWQTPHEWREMLQGHLALRGNAFCLIVEDGEGGISELLPLHPDRVKLEVVDDWGFRYVYTDRAGVQTRYLPGQVWHIRGWGGDGFVGYNPIEIAREAIGEAMQFQGYSSRFYANNATPPMWVKYPGKFADKTSRDNFREQMQGNLTGANRGKLAVLDQGMELQAVNVSQKDMQFLEARKFKVAEIARLFRVPPHMIADLDRSTNNNIEHQGIEFWSGTMAPWAERWESSIERNLLGEDTDLEVEFDMRGQMRGDAGARAAYLASRQQWGSMTGNEARAYEGDDPIDLDEMDIPYRPLNMVPIDSPANEASEAKRPVNQDPEDATSDAGGEDDDEKAARLAALLSGNASRMARRIAGGNVPSADVLAEALAIKHGAAMLWLASVSDDLQSMTEADLCASLIELSTP